MHQLVPKSPNRIEPIYFLLSLSPMKMVKMTPFYNLKSKEKKQKNKEDKNPIHVRVKLKITKLI